MLKWQLVGNPRVKTHQVLHLPVRLVGMIPVHISDLVEVINSLQQQVRLRRVRRILGAVSERL
jgi:hypothetical protein